jgi:glycosidase
MKKYFIIIASLVFISCNKNNSNSNAQPSTDPAQFGTAYTSVPAAKDAVIYQVNMRTFSAAGNLQGVTARLDSIKALGVNVVYLMPIYPVGILNGFNSPYAVKDYKAVGAEFGSLDDLRTLVTEAHNKNMAVILDWVANHTAWDNAWISNKTWYQRNDTGKIISPNGYNDVAQLNFNNDTMRAAMIEALRYWVFTANIDGYRCDFADNVPVDFWKQALLSLRSINGRKLLMLSEGSRIENFRAGFELNFGFGFFSKLEEIYGDIKPATQLNDINKNEYLNVYGEQQVVRYTTNHDVNSSDGTPQELFGGDKGSLGAFVIAAYMKGVPMIYNGQEVGTPYRLSFPFTAQKIDWSKNPSMTAEYKKIIAFRNNSPAIRGGQLITYSSDDVVAFTKELDKEKDFILVNLRNKAVNYTLPASLAGSTWTNALNGDNISFTSTVTLQPYDYLVLKK